MFELNCHFVPVHVFCLMLAIDLAFLKSNCKWLLTVDELTRQLAELNQVFVLFSVQCGKTWKNQIKMAHI